MITEILNINNEESRTDRVLFWGLIFAGLLLRAAYVSTVNVPPWNDMAQWDAARLAILHGLPYTAGWTPLYPAILALATKIFGESYTALYLVNALFSTLTCIYIYLSTKEVFGKRTAYIGLFMSVIYIDMIWYCSVIMAENLGILLLTILLYRIIKNRNFALNGIVFGLTCMAKGMFIIGLPGILLWIYYKYRADGWLKKAGLLAIFTFLVLLPWNLRNSITYRTFVPIEPTFGCTVFDGHNPYSTGGVDYLFLGSEYGKFYTAPSLSGTEKDRICLNKSIEFALHNPLREMQLFVLKSSKQMALTTSFVFYRATYPARKFMFTAAFLENMVLFPLCILGMVFSFRDRNAFGFSMIIICFTGIFITLFSAEVRKRMPFVPFMLILAAYGASLVPGILAAFRTRKTGTMRGKLITSGILIALLLSNSLYRIAIRFHDVTQRFQ